VRPAVPCIGDYTDTKLKTSAEKLISSLLNVYAPSLLNVYAPQMLKKNSQYARCHRSQSLSDDCSLVMIQDRQGKIYQ